MTKWAKKDRRKIMEGAWCYARHQASVIGGDPYEWLSYGLKFAWIDAKLEKAMDLSSWLEGQNRNEAESWELSPTKKEGKRFALPLGNPITAMCGHSEDY